MKQRLNYLAWMPNILSGGNTAHQLANAIYGEHGGSSIMLWEYVLAAGTGDTLDLWLVQKFIF